MSKRLHQLIKNQAQVKVAQQAHDNTVDNLLYGTLAVAFAGVFYFFGFYFWDTVWRVLTGG